MAAIIYTLVNSQNVYTLTNLAGLENLGYVLSKNNNCSTLDEVVSGTLPSLQSVVLPLTLDGEYTLVLTSTTQEISIAIHYYYNLQVSAIADTQLVLCGCECASCNDCSECPIYVAAITKMIAFASLTQVNYSTTYLTISNYLKCLLANEISCLLINEKYKGQSDTLNTLKILLSLHYLTQYFTEFNAAADSTEESFINTKFKFETITKCIMKFGININDIKALF